jgi:hypothetical protein
MDRLIEDYLHARGVRYFRGHHDREYFYLLDYLPHSVAGAERGRLNVHLEASGADAVLLTITPDRYYPAGGRECLDGVVTRWNALADEVRVALHDSCDPRLVGAVVHGRFQPGGAADLAESADGAVASSIGLFQELAGAVGPAQFAHSELRDAG